MRHERNPLPHPDREAWSLPRYMKWESINMFEWAPVFKWWAKPFRPFLRKRELNGGDRT